MSVLLEATAPVSSGKSARPASAPSRKEFVERSVIDASCRGPVLFFFASALLWLLAATLLGLVSSYKSHSPSILADWAFTTFGRVHPAYLSALAYGFASQAAIGVAIWLMARLSRSPVRAGWVAMISGMLWNIGVSIGILGILFGHGTSVEWLDFPPYAAGILFFAFALIGVWVVMMFKERRAGHVYVSQWYLLAAFFWFPWIYAMANIMLFGLPTKGVTTALVNWWYADNMIGCWLTPIGLAAVYYLIPKVLGRPIYSYYLSALGFWSLILFQGWTGAQHLIGGPVPIWVQTASVVAGFLMIIPVLTVGLNHHMTMQGNFSMLQYSPTLRFTVVGAMAYTLASLQGVVMAIPAFNKIVHFTHSSLAHVQFVMYGFLAMVMFGAMYYIVPRLVGCEWRSRSLIKWHFWLSFYGILVMVGMPFFGGMAQGLALDSPKVGFDLVTEATIPYLFARSVAGTVLALASLIFCFHFALMLLRLGRKEGEPTLFMKPGEEHA